MKVRMCVLAWAWAYIVVFGCCLKLNGVRKSKA